MRLTIDTKTDSKDEIRKAIKLLMGIVGAGHDVYTNEAEKPAAQPNIFDNPSPSVGNFMNMFDSIPSEPQKTEITEKPEKEVPDLEFY